jgi:hypothetical protein
MKYRSEKETVFMTIAILIQFLQKKVEIFRKLVNHIFSLKHIPGVWKKQIEMIKGCSSFSIKIKSQTKFKDFFYF